MSTPDWFSRLRSAPLFSSLTPESLKELVKELHVVSLQGGETLLRQGDPGDSLYVLLSGRLSVSIVEPDGRDRAIRELGPGQSIGELSLLTGESRSATVRAIRDSELVRLSKEAFDRLGQRHPSAILSLARTIAMRDQVAKVRKKWVKMGYELGLGIGIAAGYATLGAIGFEKRWDYAAIGTVTNLAARLCGEAKTDQILVPQRLLSTVEDLVEAEPVGHLTLKGLHRPVTTYNLLRLKG